LVNGVLVAAIAVPVEIGVDAVASSETWRVTLGVMENADTGVFSVNIDSVSGSDRWNTIEQNSLTSGLSS